MSSSQLSPRKTPSNRTPRDYDYLEKKYGKEPEISAEELKKMRWHWH